MKYRFKLDSKDAILDISDESKNKLIIATNETLGSSYKGYLKKLEYYFVFNNLKKIGRNSFDIICNDSLPKLERTEFGDMRNLYIPLEVIHSEEIQVTNETKYESAIFSIIGLEKWLFFREDGFNIDYENGIVKTKEFKNTLKSDISNITLFHNGGMPKTYSSPTRGIKLEIESHFEIDFSRSISLVELREEIRLICDFFSLLTGNKSKIETIHLGSNNHYVELDNYYFNSVNEVIDNHTFQFEINNFPKYWLKSLQDSFAMFIEKKIKYSSDFYVIRDIYGKEDKFSDYSFFSHIRVLESFYDSILKKDDEKFMDSLSRKKNLTIIEKKILILKKQRKNYFRQLLILLDHFMKIKRVACVQKLFSLAFVYNSDETLLFIKVIERMVLYRHYLAHPKRIKMSIEEKEMLWVIAKSLSIKLVSTEFLVCHSGNVDEDLIYRLSRNLNGKFDYNDNKFILK